MIKGCGVAVERRHDTHADQPKQFPLVKRSRLQVGFNTVTTAVK